MNNIYMKSKRLNGIWIDLVLDDSKVLLGGFAGGEK